MEAAHNAYRQNRKTGLTRIDMLIALYDKTLKTLDAGTQALRDGDTETFASAQIMACRCVLALLDGIDTAQGEVAENTQRLCLFVAGLIQETGVANWQNAQKLLQPMHDSFQAIREEAIALEASGKIPELNFQATYEHAVL